MTYNLGESRPAGAINEQDAEVSQVNLQAERTVREAHCGSNSHGQVPPQSVPTFIQLEVFTEHFDTSKKKTCYVFILSHFQIEAFSQ